MSGRPEVDTYREEPERGPRVVNHYHQDRSSNGNGNGTKLNNILLGCLLGIVGFLGIQLWNMNDRLARVETNMTTLLQRQ